MVTSNPLLSIITLTIPGREDALCSLREEITQQSTGLPVEHIIVPGAETVGEKMQAGYRASRGAYIATVDDDDRIAPDYITALLCWIEDKPDVITFGAQIPNHQPIWFRAGVEDEEGVGKVSSPVKTANHLCAWRRELALSSVFLPRNYGWDYVWYTLLMLNNPDIKEHHIHRVLYGYLFSSENTRAQSPQSIHASLKDGGDHTLLYKHDEDGLLAGKGLTELYRCDGSWGDYTDRPLDKMTLLREVWFR